MASPFFDVIVVGAGTAGIPLTIFAAQRGARILLIDQSDRIGGTLFYSSGQMSGAGTRPQQARGIKDDPKIHYDDIMRISSGRALPGLTRLATELGAQTINWLIDLGAELAPECPTIHYGHEPYSIPRTHWGIDAARSYLKVLQPAFDKAVATGKVDLRLNTRMVDLISEDGRVSGVVLEQNNKQERVFGKNVVLATGGYGSNPALFGKFSGGRPLYTMTSPTATGTGIEAAMRLGAKTHGENDFLPTFGGVTYADDPHRIDSGWAMIFPVQSRQPWEIFVNRRGERFVAEDVPSVDTKEHALLDQPELVFWVVFDRQIFREAPWIFRQKKREDVEAAFGSHPNFVKADTLDDLAKKCGMDPARFRKTIEDYNAAHASGRDPLGRKHMPALIAEAPFYAIKNHGSVARTFAGLRVNESLQVLDTGERPIPNLYAAGEIVGASTFAGQSFAGGMSITPALGFGRLLGEKLLKW